MSDVARWRASVSDSLFGPRLIVAQTNPGEDCNAVMMQPETAEFVLASEYDRLQAQIEFIEGYAGSYTAGWREAFETWKAKND